MSGNDYLDVVDEMIVSPAAREAFGSNRAAALVGDVLAARMQWKEGDRVRLTSGLFPEKTSWEFDIVGIYTAPPSPVNRSSFILRYDYVNEVLDAEKRDLVELVICKLRPGAQPTATARDLEQLFASGGDPVAVQNEREFLEAARLHVRDDRHHLRAVDRPGGHHGALLFGRMSISVRQRLKDFAVLSILGFRRAAWWGSSRSRRSSRCWGAGRLAVAYASIDGVLGPWIEANAGALPPHFRVHLDIARHRGARRLARRGRRGPRGAHPLRTNPSSNLRALE